MTTDTFPSIPVSRVRDLIVAFTRLPLDDARRGTLMFLSAPGVGKTQAVHAAARVCTARVVTLVASLIDRLDLAGIPYVDKDGDQDASLAPAAEVRETDESTRRVPLTRWAANELVASLSRETNPGGPVTFLYLNEVNAAPESVMPVLYRLVNSGERRIGNLTLRDNVVVIGDGNPGSCQSSGRDLPEAFKRRLAVFHVALDFAGWQKWALDGGGDRKTHGCLIPERLPAPPAGIDGRIIGFFQLTQNARHLSDFDPRKRERWQYASPAGWEKLSYHLPVLDLLAPDEWLPFCAAFIGAEAAADFAAFLRCHEKIASFRHLLDAPDRHPLPETADQLAFLCGVVANRAQESESGIAGAVILAGRMIEGVNAPAACADFGALLAGMLFRYPATRDVLLGNRGHMDRLHQALATQPSLRAAILG